MERSLAYCSGLMIPWPMRVDESMKRSFSSGYRIFPAAPVNAWSSESIRQLRLLAQSGVPIGTIAARLRRSVSAVRNKACMHGIPLRMHSPAK
jgi:hypothetical protein